MSCPSSNNNNNTSSTTREIAIYWDYENVPLPESCTAAEVSKCIHNAVSKYGRIVERRLYSDSRKFNVRLNSANRRFLDCSGFDLVDTPCRGMKETLDKKMIADVLTFAWDSSTRNDAPEAKPCVVLVTSDGDYAYTLSKLRDRGVMSIVMYGRECTVAQVLVDNADVAMSFEKDVLKLDDTTTPPSSSPNNHRTSCDGNVCIPRNQISALMKSEEVDICNPSQIRMFQKTCSVETLDLFCLCLFNVQLLARKKGGNAMCPFKCWATDLHVGGFFKKSMACDFGMERMCSVDKQRYQSVRCRAIAENLVQAGRRILNSTVGKKDIVGVSWNENAGKCDGLSTEVYLRLTPYGKSKVVSFDWDDCKKDRTGWDCGGGTGSSDMALIDMKKADCLQQQQQQQHSELLQITETLAIDPCFMDPNYRRNCFIHFCRCVREAQEATCKKGSYSFSICWGTDASVAESFRRYDSKDVYKQVRDLAIMKGLADVGRRNRKGFNNNPACHNKEIVAVNDQWHVNSGKCEGLSDEFYLRLTECGYNVSMKIPEQDLDVFLKGPLYPAAAQRGAMVPGAGGDVCGESDKNPTLSFSTSANLDLTAKKMMAAASSQSTLATEDSDSSRCTASWKRSPNESTAAGYQSSRGGPSLCPNEGAEVLKSCVMKMQSMAGGRCSSSNPWVTDSSVSAYFRSDTPWNNSSRATTRNIVSKDYKMARENAITKGIIEAGRRKIKSFGCREIVKVVWQEQAGKGEGLAPEVYLRLGERFWKSTRDMTEMGGTTTTSTFGGTSPSVGKSILPTNAPVDEKTFSYNNAKPSKESSLVAAAKDNKSTKHMCPVERMIFRLSGGKNKQQKTATSSADVDGSKSSFLRGLICRSDTPDKNVSPTLALESTTIPNQYIPDEPSFHLSANQQEIAVPEDETDSFQSCPAAGEQELLESTDVSTAVGTADSSQTMSTMTELDTRDDFFTFLACITKAHLLVMKKGTSSAYSWATDSAVAGIFFDEIYMRPSSSVGLSKTSVKPRYKKVRDKAIQEGLVEAGRRRLDMGGNVKRIDAVSWCADYGKSDVMSPELYLRLTESGGSVVASSQEINLS